MKKSWKRLNVIAAACGFLMATAGQVQAMGLLQAYEAALMNDPAYRAAVSENIAGKEYRNIGRAGLLPTIQYNYGTSKNRAEQTQPNPFVVAQPDRPTITSDYDYTSLTNTLSLRQTLFSLDTTARYRQGIAQTNYSDAIFSARSKDLIIRLVSAYADAKYAEDQLDLFRAQRDAYAEQKRINERMFEKGEGTKTDMLETQAKLDIAESQVIEAQDNLLNARNTFSAIVGKDVTQLDGLRPEFKVMPGSLSGFDEWMQVAMDNNPEISAAQYTVESAEQEISKSKAGHTPRLELNASYNRAIADSLTNRTQDQTIKSIGVSLIIPIYSGGYVNAISNQAVANRDKAKADLESTRNRISIELRKQYNAVQTSVTKIGALQKSVDSSTLLVEATKQSVKGGVRINLDVLSAEQQLVAAKRDLAQAKYNYLISFLKLRVAAGTVNMDDMQAVANYFSPMN
ncbi:TolC family outer membrane protein [Undibacterium sp. TS12]|uniref:TolC family outer membrane protein n=1 Tax=Undibacterium sp. TS12 TaxID=2908202 RepID=UPI001F4D06EA|nr:TolC family outer membrane protein [Undibacterium sp. TS12]MCH8621110.1 TolC family outer membrane protein [Undibacterium sp. TS12]